MPHLFMYVLKTKTLVYNPLAASRGGASSAGIALLQFGYALEGVCYLAGANPARQGSFQPVSNRSGGGGDEIAEVSGVEGRFGRLGDDAGRNVQ